MNAARDLRRKAARESVKTEAFGVHALVSGGEAMEPLAEDPAERMWAAVRHASGQAARGRAAGLWRGLSHAAAADAMAIAPRRPSPGMSMKRRNG